MISPEDTENSVYTAIKGGYRMIDTANAYMNERSLNSNNGWNVTSSLSFLNMPIHCSAYRLVRQKRYYSI